MSNTDMPKTIHHGRNVKRIREILGIKQEALAAELGEEWTQKRISMLEAKEVLEPQVIDQLAKALKVPAEAIRNFNEDATFNIISNTFQDFRDNAHASALNYNCSFNPIDKWLEALEENKRLYEALLKSEREKVAMLEKLLNERKK